MDETTQPRADDALATREPVATELHDLGRMEYKAAWDLQVAIQNAQIAGERGGVVLFVEHPPTITIGRRGTPDEVVAPRKVLEARGITVTETDRGGQITYHGPGQLVVYPLLNLHELGIGVHGFMRAMEDSVILYLESLGLKPYRWKDRTGVWLGKEKVCAMGIRVRRWWTLHGLALNVTTEMNHFGMIIPCGIRDRGVTSLQTVMNETAPSFEEVKAGMRGSLAEAFNLTWTEPKPLP